MDLLKELAAVLGILGGWSLLLWWAGQWCEKGIIGTVFTSVVLTASAIALITFFFIRHDLGTITVSAKNGIVDKVNEKALAADLNLDKYQQDGEYMRIVDGRGRQYFALVPSSIYSEVHSLKLHSSSLFLVSFTFLIGKVSSVYIIITWGKLFAFLTSFAACFYVWFSGSEGKIAFLVPDPSD